jgi:hypothetical protein
MCLTHVARAVSVSHPVPGSSSMSPTIRRSGRLRALNRKSYVSTQEPGEVQIGTEDSDVIDLEYRPAKKLCPNKKTASRECSQVFKELPNEIIIEVWPGPPYGASRVLKLFT